MRYVMIVNPIAGGGRALQIADTLAETLRKEYHAECRLAKTEASGHAEALAREAAADPDTAMVLIAGGDGTLSEAARGLSGSDLPIGIIPAGSGNDFAHCLGLPKDPLEALRFAMSHAPRAIDHCTLNDGSFLNIIGTGFDVTTLDYTEMYRGKYHGRLPYVLGVLQAMRKSRGQHLRVTVDGKTEEGEYLICTAGNGNFLGGGFPVNPTARPDDGRLDVVLIRPIARWKLPVYLAGMLKGKHIHYRVTRHLEAEHVIFEGKGMRVDVDGEVIPMDRAEIGIRRGALRIVCP